MNRLRATPVFYAMRGVQGFTDTLAFTVLTVYYIVAAGLTPLQLVLVGTALETTYFVCTAPLGAMADARSRRLMVIIGWFLTGGSYVMIGLLPSFGGIVLGNAVMGVGAAFADGAEEAWIAGEVGEQTVGRLFIRSGQIARAVSLPTMLLSVGLASIRLDLPWLIAGSVHMAMAGLLLAAMPERNFRPAPAGRRLAMVETLRNGIRAVRGHTLLLAILAVGLAVGAAVEGYDRLGQAHLLKDFAFPAIGGFKPVVWFGIIGVLGTLASLFVTEVFRRRLEAISRRSIPTAGALFGLNVAAIASLFLFGFVRTFGLAVGAMIAIEVVRSLIRPLSGAFLVQNTEPKVRATVLSLVGMSYSFGEAAGGPVVGLVGNASLPGAMYACGLLTTPVLVLYGWVTRRRRPAEATA